MVRSLDASTQAAVRDTSRIARANLVLVHAKDGEGAVVYFGFTDYGENVTLNIVDGFNGQTVSRDFYGDNSPIVSMDPVPLKIGFEVDTTQIVLNPLHAAVASMARGHDIRNAKVQVLRAWLNVDTGVPVAAPRSRRVGYVNGAPIGTGRTFGRSSVTLKVVSTTRELTRVNTALWSDETMRLRSDDRILRYVDNTAQVPVWWGEESGTS